MIDQTLKYETWKHGVSLLPWSHTSEQSPSLLSTLSCLKLLCLHVLLRPVKEIWRHRIHCLPRPLPLCVTTPSFLKFTLPYLSPRSWKPDLQNSFIRETPYFLLRFSQDLNVFSKIHSFSAWPSFLVLCNALPCFLNFLLPYDRWWFSYSLLSFS